jgi:hypothetical protein
VRKIFLIIGDFAITFNKTMAAARRPENHGKTAGFPSDLKVNLKKTGLILPANPV